MADAAVAAIAQDSPHQSRFVVMIDLSGRALLADGAEVALRSDHRFDVAGTDAVALFQMVVA